MMIQAVTKRNGYSETDKMEIRNDKKLWSAKQSNGEGTILQELKEVTEH